MPRTRKEIAKPVSKNAGSYKSQSHKVEAKTGSHKRQKMKVSAIKEDHNEKLAASEYKEIKKRKPLKTSGRLSAEQVATAILLSPKSVTRRGVKSKEEELEYDSESEFRTSSQLKADVSDCLKKKIQTKKGVRPAKVKESILNFMPGSKVTEPAKRSPGRPRKEKSVVSKDTMCERRRNSESDEDEEESPRNKYSRKSKVQATDVLGTTPNRQSINEPLSSEDGNGMNAEDHDKKPVIPEGPAVIKGKKQKLIPVSKFSVNGAKKRGKKGDDQEAVTAGKPPAIGAKKRRASNAQNQEPATSDDSAPVGAKKRRASKAQNQEAGTADSSTPVVAKKRASKAQKQEPTTPDSSTPVVAKKRASKAQNQEAATPDNSTPVGTKKRASKAQNQEAATADNSTPVGTKKRASKAQNQKAATPDSSTPVGAKKRASKAQKHEPTTPDNSTPVGTKKRTSKAQNQEEATPDNSTPVGAKKRASKAQNQEEATPDNSTPVGTKKRASKAQKHEPTTPDSSTPVGAKKRASKAQKQESATPDNSTTVGAKKRTSKAQNQEPATPDSSTPVGAKKRRASSGDVTMKSKKARLSQQNQPDDPYDFEAYAWSSEPRPVEKKRRVRQALKKSQRTGPAGRKTSKAMAHLFFIQPSKVVRKKPVGAEREEPCSSIADEIAEIVVQPPATCVDDEVMVGPRLSAGRAQFGLPSAGGLGGLNSASTPRLTAEALVRPPLDDPISPIHLEPSGTPVPDARGANEVRPLVESSRTNSQEHLPERPESPPASQDDSDAAKGRQPGEKVEEKSAADSPSKSRRKKKDEKEKDEFDLWLSKFNQELSDIEAFQLSIDGTH